MDLSPSTCSERTLRACCKKLTWALTMLTKTRRWNQQTSSLCMRTETNTFSTWQNLAKWTWQYASSLRHLERFWCPPTMIALCSTKNKNGWRPHRKCHILTLETWIEALYKYTLAIQLASLTQIRIIRRVKQIKKSLQVNLKRILNNTKPNDESCWRRMKQMKRPSMKSECMINWSQSSKESSHMLEVITIFPNPPKLLLD